MLELHVLEHNPALHILAFCVLRDHLFKVVENGHRLFRLLGGLQLLVLFNCLVSLLQLCHVGVDLVAGKGKPANLAQNRLDVVVLYFIFGKSEVFQGSVGLHHVSDGFEGFLGNGVVADIKDLQGFIGRVGVGRVGFEHVAHLDHVLVLQVVGPQKQHLQFVILLEQLGKQAEFFSALPLVESVGGLELGDIVVLVEGVPVEEQVLHGAVVLAEVVNEH